MSDTRTRRMFEPGIGAMVLLAGDISRGNLPICPNGILEIPSGTRPKGFHLGLLVPKGARVVILQKDVGKEQGGYHRQGLIALDDVLVGYQAWLLQNPIQVISTKRNTWTAWHDEQPNRVDCFLVDEDGRLGLFQIGVITHDNGQTFRLLGEWRWKGRLFRQNGGFVTKPDDPFWGAFSPKPNGTRNGVFEVADFRDLLATASIALWQGSEEELYPALDPVAVGEARVDWYITFAGQTGQGIVQLHDGSMAWVHGADLIADPDRDGIKRLRRNDRLAYAGFHENWGSKGGLPKLINPQKVS